MGQQLKVAFVGKSKTLTTACARYFYKEYKWVILGLDDELDRFLRHMYSLHYQQRNEVLWEDRLRFYDAIYRIDPDIFAKRVVKLVSYKTRNVVVPDARYLNEIKILKEAGFIFVRVVAPKNFNGRKPNINLLTKGTNAGALANYEWFASDANSYVDAKYTINATGKTAPKSALDALIINLTQENSGPQ